MGQKLLVPHRYLFFFFALPALLHLFQLSTVWEASQQDKQLFVKRGKSEVGGVGGECASGEGEISCDPARAHSEKTMRCWKSPSSSQRTLPLPVTVLF